MRIGSPQGGAQTVQRGGNLVERKRKTTAQIDWRGVVVDAQGPDRHSEIIKSCAVQAYCSLQES